MTEHKFDDIIDGLAYCSRCGWWQGASPAVCESKTTTSAERDEAVRAFLDALAMPDGRDVAAAWDRVTMLYGRFGSVMKRYAFEQYLNELARTKRTAP